MNFGPLIWYRNKFYSLPAKKPFPSFWGRLFIFHEPVITGAYSFVLMYAFKHIREFHIISFVCLINTGSAS
jgi:hypothetical protein